MKRHGLLFVFAVTLAAAISVGCGGYDACGDKNCGDPCTVCDPDDPECVESTEAKACNSRGVCATAASPMCS
jgi:hypothetical protein